MKHVRLLDQVREATARAFPGPDPLAKPRARRAGLRREAVTREEVDEAIARYRRRGGVVRRVPTVQDGPSGGRKVQQMVLGQAAGGRRVRG